MKRYSRRDFTVYEFKGDDEAAETASGRFISRFGKRRTPAAEESTISEYTFPKAFESKVVAEEMIDKVQRSFSSTIGQTNEVPTSSASHNVPDVMFQHVIESQDFASLCTQEDPPVGEGPSSMVPDSDDDSNYALSDKQSNGMEISVSLEDDDSCASTPDHVDHQGSLEDRASAGCWTGFSGAEDVNMPVTVLAEYLMYGSELYAESQLIFLSHCIKIECLDVSGKQFMSEWRTTDILHISCQWSQSVGTSWVKVCLKPSIDSKQVAGDDTSVVVRFCVPDFQWLDKEQKIMLLAPIYKDIFSTASAAKLAEEEDEVLGWSPYISRHYLTDFKESCAEIIYPKGDPDAVTITNRDLDLLQPETFVNDTIIDFYIKYLIYKAQPQEKHRFHFFNSFFFRKLADLDKDPSSAAEGRAAFLRVRKWTRKVNIFEKDYLFIPVNFNLHWSLLIICHPGEVAHIKEESIHEACRIPCILHMNSMKGSHSGLKDLVQSYLWEEWKERHQESLSFSNFSNLRFIPLELPQQQNSFDCGLFLLHYVELFLKEAPVNFNPFTITRFSNFLNMDWFIPDEASLKRFRIRNLICDLLHDCRSGSPSCGSWHCSEPSTKSAEKNSIEFPTCSPMKTSNISMGSAVHDKDDDKMSSLSSTDHVGHDRMAVLNHVSEGRTRRKTSDDSERHILLQDNSRHKIRSTMSPIEEEPSGQFVLAPQESSHPLNDILNKKMAVASYDLKGADLLTNEEDNSMEEDSSPNITSCSSINSLEHNNTEVDVDNLRQDGMIGDAVHQRRGMVIKRSPGNCEDTQDGPSLVSREVLDTRVIQGSKEAGNTLLGSSACCPETAADSCEELGVIKIKEPSDREHDLLPGEDSTPTPGMQHLKRQKVMHEGSKHS